MYIKLLQADSWVCIDQQLARSLDTDVPSAGNAVHHTAFAMRRGRFHQERLKMALGYVRVCYRELRGASKRAKKQAMPPAMTWGNINSQLQKHLSPWFLFFFSMAPRAEWRAHVCPGPLPSQDPVCWCKLPSLLSSGSTGNSKFSLCFSSEPKIGEVKSFNFLLMCLIFFTQSDSRCSAFMPSWDCGEAASYKYLLLTNIIVHVQWTVNSSEVFE